MDASSIAVAVLGFVTALILLIVAVLGLLKFVRKRPSRPLIEVSGDHNIIDGTWTIHGGRLHSGGDPPTDPPAMRSPLLPPIGSSHISWRDWLFLWAAVLLVSLAAGLGTWLLILWDPLPG